MRLLWLWYQFLLTHPRSVLLTGITVLGVGAWGWGQLPVGLWPDFDLPYLTIGVNVPGRDAASIETSYLSPLRDQVRRQPGVTDIQSWALSGSGEICLDYAWGTDMDLAYFQILEALSQAQLAFPDREVIPFVRPVGAEFLPIFQLYLTDTTLTVLEQKEFVSQVLRRRLEQLAGVSRCEVIGGPKAEIAIVPNWLRLQQYRLSMRHLASAIQNASYDWGIVRMEAEGRLLTVRLRDQLTNYQEIERLPIRLSSGRTIPLREIARVVKQPAPDYAAVTGSRDNGVLLHIYQQSGGDIRAISRRIMDELGQWRQQYPSLSVEKVSDSVSLVNNVLDTFQRSLYWGAGLAALIIFLVLGSLREGGLIALLVPASLCMVGVGFLLTGIGMNLLTLAGLGIAVGVLIDNGIIVLDNINHHQGKGLPLQQAIITGTSEIFGPLLSSAMTTVCVFLPLTLLGGLMGHFLKDQVLAIVWALSASLLGALGLLPVLCQQLIHPSHHLPSHRTTWSRQILSWYEQGIRAVFQYGRAAIVVCVVLLSVSLLSVRWLPMQVFPDYRTEESAIRIDWGGSTPFPSALAQTKRVHRFLSSHAEIENVFGWVGALEVPGSMYRQLPHQALLQLTWNEPQQSDQLINALRATLAARFPQGQFDVQSPLSSFNVVLPQPARELVFDLSWPSGVLPPDSATIAPLLTQLTDSDYTDELHSPYLSSTSVRAIHIDQAALIKYRVTQQEVTDALQSALGRQQLGRLMNPNEPTPIRLSGAQGPSLTAVLQTYHIPQSGVPLAALVNVREQTSPTVWYAGAEGVRQRVEWEGTGGHDTIQAMAQHFARSRGLLLRTSGEHVSGSSQQLDLLWLLLTGIALLYLIMAAQFESLWIPLLIVATLPCAFCGSVLALWICGASLNIMSGLGFLMVSGVAVNDSILKLSTIRLYLRQGRELREAIIEAGTHRFRAIMLTSLTTILAVLPILAMDNMGTDIQRPLAIAMIGGMVVATIVSLIILPVLFEKLARIFPL